MLIFEISEEVFFCKKNIKYFIKNSLIYLKSNLRFETAVFKPAAPLPKNTHTPFNVKDFRSHDLYNATQLNIQKNITFDRSSKVSNEMVTYKENHDGNIDTNKYPQ